MVNPLLLSSLSMNGQSVLEHARLAVLTYSGRLYHCPQVFPFRRMQRLVFELPTPAEPLLGALYLARERQALIAWQATFTTLMPLEESSYLVWFHWDARTIELQLATPWEAGT